MTPDVTDESPAWRNLRRHRERWAQIERDNPAVEPVVTPITILREEIRIAHVNLTMARTMLAVHMFHRPRDRHWTGEPECPLVIAAADQVELWECRIRTLERRAKVAADAQRAASRK